VLGDDPGPRALARCASSRRGDGVPIFRLLLCSWPPYNLPEHRIASSIVRRAAKIGRKRPRRSLPVPPPGDWRELLLELPNTYLGSELILLLRQIRLASWVEPETRKSAEGPGCDPEPNVDLFCRKTPLHVAERRTEALAEASTMLRPHLHTMMRLISRSLPSITELARACERVAEWAEDEGYPKTALQFAESAAGISPRDPYFAFIAARTNRVLGERWRAEVLYLRAIRIAYRELNWEVYTRANLGLGRLLADAGRFRAAAEKYRTAARSALDQGEEWLAAQTYHDIAVLNFEQGDLEHAAAFALLALETYPRHNERLPVAVHDLVFLYVSEHHYSEVATILDVLVRLPLRPQDQVLVFGTLARTAGGLQDEDKFAAAESRVLSLAPHHEAHAGAALLNLAFGARALGHWDLAAQYAKRGIAAARARRQKHVVQVGKEFLKEIRKRTHPPAPAPPLTGVPAQVLSKVEEFVREQLSGWRANTWTRKENQSSVATLGRV
jgi:tetratricopeptide (TPR) repeat protein